MMGRSPESQAGGVGSESTEASPWMGGYPDKAVPNTAWLRLFFGQEMEDRAKREVYGGPTTCWEHWGRLGVVASLQQPGSSCLLTVLSAHCLAGFWPLLQQQQQHNLPVTQGAVFALLLPKTTVPWRAACN